MPLVERIAFNIKDMNLKFTAISEKFSVCESFDCASYVHDRI